MTYSHIASWYNFLTYPWEKQHVKWRKKLLTSCKGSVCELGVGTGINLRYYPNNITLIAVDNSQSMLAHAKQQATNKSIDYTFINSSVQELTLKDHSIDDCIATFLFNTIPNPEIPKCLDKIAKILTPSGRLRCVIPVKSSHFVMKWIQRLTFPINRALYNVQRDCKLETMINDHPSLVITAKKYLNKSKSILLLEGQVSSDSYDT